MAEAKANNEEAQVSGWGLALKLRGKEAIDRLILVGALATLIGLNYVFNRSIVEEVKLLHKGREDAVKDLRADHKDSREVMEALIYVLALSPEKRPAMLDSLRIPERLRRQRAAE